MSNCDREPIHLVGRVQPHGGLLAFDVKLLQLRHYSANISQWLARTPEVGEPLEQLFAVDSAAALRSVACDAADVVRPLRLRWQEQAHASFVAAAHVHREFLIVEFDQPRASAETSVDSDALSLTLRLNLANQRLQHCGSPRELYQGVTAELRRLCGFDRVMLYRFSDDGHGEVIGESAREGLESFLGLHYPASDIPQQARRLYVLNTVRGIADVNATPVPICPPCDAETRQPLDLSLCCHRAVSPIHVEYLRNMGVCASMSISLVREDSLWGLIACHHYSPKALRLEERAACEIMGIVVANYLTAKDVQQAGWERDMRRRRFHHVLKRITQTPGVWDALEHVGEELMSVLDASGIAVLSSRGAKLVGLTPTGDDVQAIREAVERERGEADVWSSHEIGQLVPALSRKPHSMRVDAGGEGRVPTAGCLAIPLFAPEVDWLLFFRDEVVREVSWGGDPNKAVDEEPMRLSPRKSFETWKQVVSGQSRPWSSVDREVAEELRFGLLELLGLRAAELVRLNDELEKLNADLDSFAYAASHDLREPLRGISQAVYFLEGELPAETRQASRRRLDTLSALATRMDELIQGLLRLSRAGRRDLQLERVSLAEVAREAAEMVLGRPMPPDCELIVSADVDFDADYSCVRELLGNLISNAIKYNDSRQKRIKIGAETGPDGVRHFFVHDNGIGIATQFREEVFQIFRRLHLPQEYGGGSGAGLSICQRIVLRHGGKIWVEPNDAGGSTFFFTLSVVSKGE
ncbi:MAG: GAF domain-containing protein [Planctomycetales bacterium]|nr:GAF domain-containing protein [Planctomycetales bacterium]